MNRVAVFCSSHEGLPESVTHAAAELGAWIGRQNLMLVYGGVGKGLMEVVARAVKSNGGRVMGIIPDKFSQTGLTSEYVDIEVPVVDLNDRKSAMLRESDLFIALPGGIGTLDEIFMVMASSAVGEHKKQLILFNPDGYWEPLIGTLKMMEQQGYIAPGFTSRIKMPDSIESLTALLTH